MVDARIGKRADSGEYRLCGVARRSVGALVKGHAGRSATVRISARFAVTASLSEAMQQVCHRAGGRSCLSLIEKS
jgi:hypothetical protein